MNGKFFKFEDGIVYNVDYIVDVIKCTDYSDFLIKYADNSGTFNFRATLHDYDNFVERFAV